MDTLGIGARSGSSERIDAAIARALRNQSGTGSFGLWRPGRGDRWLDAYVTDFLSRARAEGHAVPKSAFRGALDNLSSALSYAGDFRSGGEAIAYALMVLAREGLASIGDLRYYADVKAQALATPMARAQLGAALAFYGERTRADRLFRMASMQVLDASESGRDVGLRPDYGSRLRDAAAVLALAAEARSEAADAQALTDALLELDRGRTSTQENVWLLLAANASLERARQGLRVDGLPPGGFEIDNPRLLRSGAIDGLDWLTTLTRVRTAEFRTDRFLAAVDHDGKGSFNLAYIVRAVSPGRFRHPAAVVEDMYRPEFRAWTDTARVEVVEAQ